MNPTREGYVSIRPGDAVGKPSTSSVNFVAGQVVANSATVALSATGEVQIYFYGSGNAGTVDVVLDVVGYFVAAGTGAEGPEGPAGPAGPAGEPGTDGAVGPQPRRPK